MKISIIITSYNYANFIQESIESVINQTYPHWELIIIDDGSKDNSLNIIKKYCDNDSRIKLFTHKNNENKGLVESIKLGIKKSQYDWIAFLESDDCLSPNYLEEKIKFLSRHPKCNFIYNDIECFGNPIKIKQMQKYFSKLNNFWNKEEIKDVFNEFGTQNIIPTFSCVMCNKTELLKYDFDTVCLPVIDYWLWWQFSENNQFGYINKKLTRWRLHISSYLSDASRTLKYYLQRSRFVPKIIKKFTRKPKLCTLYTLEKKQILGTIIYTLFFIARKITIIHNRLKKYI